MERLSHEFDAVGFYLSGHPLDSYERVLHKLGVKRYAEFEAMAERGACEGRLAGIVIAARERKSQRGNKFAFGLFSDTTGQFEAVIFSDTLAAARDLLEPGTPVLLSVSAERDGDTMKMRVEGIEALDKAAANVQRGLKVVLDRRLIEKNADPMALLKSRLKPGGKGEIRLVVALGDRGKEVEFVVPGRYDVSPSIAGILATTPGVVEVLEI
jgi:DNA polymerase-3 subunit alpha